MREIQSVGVWPVGLVSTDPPPSVSDAGDPVCGRVAGRSGRRGDGGATPGGQRSRYRLAHPLATRPSLRHRHGRVRHQRPVGSDVTGWPTTQSRTASPDTGTQRIPGYPLSRPSHVNACYAIHLIALHEGGCNVLFRICTLYT